MKETQVLSIRNILKYCLIVLIMLLSVGIILMIVVPMGMWGYRTIFVGDISFNVASGHIAYEDLITFSISVLSILVAIITLGAGLLSVFGYIHIRKAAEDKAVTAANKAIDKEIASYISDLDVRVGKIVNDYLRSFSYEKTFDELLTRKIKEIGLSKLTTDSELKELEEINKIIDSTISDVSSEDKK